jgi:hypothetical protein
MTSRGTFGKFAAFPAFSAKTTGADIRLEF